MLGVGLALSSSLCWGISDFIGGVQSRRTAVLRVVLITQAVGLVVLGVILAVRGQGAPALHRLLPAVGGGVVGVAGLAAFYRALSIGTMSIVAPIAATGVVVPVVVGIAGGEHPAAPQVAGIAAAIVGVVLASRERDHRGSPTQAGRSSVALALLAALGFGCFFVGLRSSSRADPLWATFAARAAAVLALSLFAAVRPSGLRGRGGLRLLAVAGTLDMSANVLFAVATRHGLLSVVSVLAALYPLATVALARVVLGEKVRRVQEVGVVAALTGVVLIAAG